MSNFAILIRPTPRDGWEVFCEGLDRVEAEGVYRRVLETGVSGRVQLVEMEIIKTTKARRPPKAAT